MQAWTRWIRIYGKTALFIAALLALFAFGYHNLNYNWQWYRVWPYLVTVTEEGLAAGLLMKGMLVTLKISGISLLLTLGIGFSTAFMRLSSSPVLNALVVCYVESIRNTPLLIQLFVIYFVISPVMDLSAFSSAVIALSLFEGAYASEIIRSGITAVDHGQWEAAFSLGMSPFGTFREVILPQALRQILPMLAGQGVSLIKDSALVSTISIFDLTMQGQSIVAETFLTFEIWFTVAFCYLVLTASLSACIARWERRVGVGQG
ncbi:amino acid ABC transporter permease [Desulfoluna spongiiphila]|uniref:Putative glutamine transport system permease protein GlnP n=1 Tax=Desulfoluna spongiiphila TaxID=419481 RepID=A0A1G5ARC2_9BACT|nr:amino acid ABC transporter permease [Desulfoluna spongiiphila]SCX80370.1 amino acid ABC transporter membrane protein 1, PAAT family [Desulfoluna spongiiphila]